MDVDESINEDTLAKASRELGARLVRGLRDYRVGLPAHRDCFLPAYDAQGNLISIRTYYKVCHIYILATHMCDPCAHPVANPPAKLLCFQGNRTMTNKDLKSVRDNLHKFGGINATVESVLSTDQSVLSAQSNPTPESFVPYLTQRSY